MDSDAQKYELAYLIMPSLSEDEALAVAGKLSGLIESEQGAIRHLETPKKRALAYPVKKQGMAYLGWTTFSMAPASVKRLEKNIAAAPEVLRHLIVEEQAEKRVPFVRPFSPATGRAAPKAIPREAEKAGEEKLDLETLDKKLEEILGR